MLRKVSMLVYAAIAYALALASLLYLVGFLTNAGVPKGISDGPLRAPWLAALFDAALIGLFGLRHSITARTAFNRWWTRIVPAPIERATYLYMTVIMTAGLVALWSPIPISIWHVGSGPLAAGVFAAYLAVWAMVVATTFHFGHFSFFGLAQAWENFRASQSKRSAMTARYLYALVRHPDQPRMDDCAAHPVAPDGRNLRLHHARDTVRRGRSDR